MSKILQNELTRELAIQIINDSPLLLSLLCDLNLLPEQVKQDTKEEFYMLSVVAHIEQLENELAEARQLLSRVEDHYRAVQEIIKFLEKPT